MTSWLILQVIWNLKSASYALAIITIVLVNDHINFLNKQKWIKLNIENNRELMQPHADPNSEFSDFAIKNSKRNACILMDFENYLFLFIQFFISYHKIIFYKVSNGSVEVDFRL